MKIKKSELIHIIKEEAEKYKKYSDLKEKKQKLEKQLNEIYDMQETNTGLAEEGGFGDTFKKAGRLLGIGKPMDSEIANEMNHIKGHPTASAAVKYWANISGESEDEIMKKLAYFFASENRPPSYKYDLNAKKFVSNTNIKSVPLHLETDLMESKKKTKTTKK